MKFDLMGSKPDLDVPTLNYVWDILRRYNYLPPKNEREREAHAERARIMNRIEELANIELEVK